METQPLTDLTVAELDLVPDPPPPAVESCDEHAAWQPDGLDHLPRLRLVVPSASALARVLGLTPQAITNRCAGNPDFARRTDGRWSVLGAVGWWRHYTCDVRRAHDAAGRPWLNPLTELTIDHFRTLLVRTRAERGDVSVSDDDGATWEAVPPVLELLRARDPRLDFWSREELGATIAANRIVFDASDAWQHLGYWIARLVEGGVLQADPAERLLAHLRREAAADFADMCEPDGGDG